MRIVLAVLLAAVCTASSAQPGDPVEALAASLALSPDQADLVAEILDLRDPASTWTLAAELVPTLDERQRQALFARPERPEGMRGARTSRRGRDGDRSRDPARVAVGRAARDAALGLSEQQSAAFDAALESLDRREATRALRDGTVPDVVADILAPDQVELYRAHLALQGHLRRSMRQARRAQ